VVSREIPTLHDRVSQPHDILAFERVMVSERRVGATACDLGARERCRNPDRPAAAQRFDREAAALIATLDRIGALDAHSHLLNIAIG
jgi:hypothetical protein